MEHSLTQNNNLFRIVARGILRALQAHLPESAYRALYFPLFRFYKGALRFRYLCRMALHAGSGGGMKMRRWVWRVMPYSLVGAGGLETTFRLGEKVNERGVEGAFVELGVARGGAAALLAANAFAPGSMDRTLWLFDSFEGLPDPTSEDLVDGVTGSHIRPLPRGSCLGAIEEVRDLLFNRFRFPQEKIRFVKGWFQETLPIRRRDIGRIAILRIDGDWYESTKVCLEYLYDQVAENGFVYIDDYAVCHGCKRAVDEFLAARGLDIDLSFDGRGGCYFKKLSRELTPVG